MAIEFGSLSLRNDANLQEYYKLENVTAEVTTPGNDLTNNGTATFVAAKFNNGVSGGSSDADKTLSIASALGLTNGSYGISFWAKVLTAPSSVTYNFLELFETTTDISLLVEYVDTAGTKTVVFHRVKVGVADEVASFAIDLGIADLHHFVITYNGTTIKGYIDNIERASFAASGNGSSATATKFCIMGGRTDNTSNNFLGIVDDVALFNRNLTAADVDLIYNGPAVTDEDTGGVFLLS